MNPSLVLPAELTVYKAAELREEWLAWLRTLPVPLPVCRANGHAVAEADGAGMQLLVSLSHSLAKRHTVLRIADPSETLRDACDALGLQMLLEDTPDGAAP